MKANPVYILGVLLFLLLLLLFRISSEQSRIEQNVLALAALESKGVMIKELKQSWESPKKASQRIDALLSHPSLKGLEVHKDSKAGRMRINIANLDKKALDGLTSKLLNETFVIKELSIERLSEHNATLSLEIQL